VTEEAENWDDLTEALPEVSRAYYELLSVRSDERAGTKRVIQAQAEFEAAVAKRAAVLLAHWTEEDGHREEAGHLPSLGRVFQRYYADTIRLVEKKGRKR